MKLPVITMDNKKDGTVTASDAVFGLPVRADILARAVNWQLAKRRAGTHATKGRSDIAATKAKMYRQKGTGRARHAQRSANIFRGGGVVFGPKPRDHAHKLPKKVRALALKTALSDKASTGSLFVVKSFDAKDGKAKSVQGFFQGRGNVLCMDKANEDFLRATGNIKHVHILPPEGANVYDILRAGQVILSESALKAIEERFNDSEK